MLVLLQERQAGLHSRQVAPDRSSRRAPYWPPSWVPSTGTDGRVGEWVARLGGGACNPDVLVAHHAAIADGCCRRAWNLAAASVSVPSCTGEESGCPDPSRWLVPLPCPLPGKATVVAVAVSWRPESGPGAGRPARRHHGRGVRPAR